MDTSKPSGWDANILPSLVLYQRRRDQAHNLPRPGRRTRALLSVYLARERAALAAGMQAAGDLARAAFLKGIVNECGAQVSRLIEAADTPEKRRAALDEVTRLHALAERAAAELEEMTHA